MLILRAFTNNHKDEKPDTKMSYTSKEINKEKVGDVYLAMYKQGSDSEKRAHYSIVIDTAGETTNEKIVGCELHLGADKKTRVTGFVGGKREKPRNEFLKIIPVGKIENIYHKERPSAWGKALEFEGNKWYDEFVKENGGEEKWSAEVNCQKYTRFVIQKLELPIPKGIEFVASDKYPGAVDVGIMIISAYANSPHSEHVIQF